MVPSPILLAAREMLSFVPRDSQHLWISGYEHLVSVQLPFNHRFSADLPWLEYRSTDVSPALPRFWVSGA
jgi:hypothetical protein